MAAPDPLRIPWLLRYRAAARGASEFRRLATLATHQHAEVRFGPRCWLGPRFALQIPGPGTFEVSAGVEFRRDFYCEIGGSGSVCIGAGSIFTGAAMIQVSTSLTVGERCVFGQSLMIADGNHRWDDPSRHLLDQGYDFRSIVVGDGAVILSKCTLLASVGERSVVAAHAVVTEDVPPFCLAGGVPARVLRYFGPPERRPAGVDR